MPSTSISDALFTKTQQRVLGLIYGKPDRSFYTNEIVRWADMGRGTVKRELDRLAAAGLLLVSRAGNQLHYQANAGNPVYPELLSIVRKTFGVAGVIRQALKPLDAQIEFAFIYGSIAKGTETSESDVDLMIASESLTHSDVMSSLIEAEQALGREVNPTIYGLEQAKNKLKEKNAFLTRVMEQPKIWIKGSDDDIEKLGQPRKGKPTQTGAT